MMASLSPSGISAQDIVMFEKKNRGSGLYGRGFASLPRDVHASTHDGLTTGTSESMAIWYSGKSEVGEMRCV